MYSKIASLKVLRSIIAISAERYNFNPDDILAEVMANTKPRNYYENLKLVRAEAVSKAIYLNMMGLIPWLGLEPELATTTSGTVVKKVGKVDRAAYMEVRVPAYPEFGIKEHKFLIFRSDYVRTLDYRPHIEPALRKLWKFETEPSYVRIISVNYKDLTTKRSYSVVTASVLDFFLALVKLGF